jgi:alkanesulfonate monooxygenase SsuD/methylene tetrahydromethanopterin reductase-like flavin-dependent oxidoreductase (luciferase family)
MDFGIFDHCDANGLPLQEFYDSRLKIVEAYDRGGFFCYHVAEHHATPLGLAASPGVYLAAVAQRTKNLRFGPLVYTLPLYHPLRLTEEICMLDQLSRGRMQVGIGRGISPLETKGFGIDPAERVERTEEIRQVMMQGLTGKTVDFQGKYYSYSKVPMELEPFQKPHPPIWIGAATADSAARAARNGHNFVSLSTAAETRELTDRYRAAWKEAHGDKPVPKLGLGRFIVVAETDTAARAIASRAYRKWHDSFHHLWRKHGMVPTQGERASEFDEIMDGGRGVAGTPETCIKMLTAQLAESGCNYSVGQFVFGDMSLEEALGSIDLFIRKVMPAIQQSLPS